jgi:hypothetical protein
VSPHRLHRVELSRRDRPVTLRARHLELLGIKRERAERFRGLQQHFKRDAHVPSDGLRRVELSR